jgi:DNA-directed RNA polymerase specialized sigma54-like protein
MVCYGCKTELFGYQAYQSMYCSQCLNRRAVEEQTRIQAQIAERQFEMQQEQLRDMQEQRELMEQRQYQQRQSFSSKPKEEKVDLGKLLKKLCPRPLSEIDEETERTGGLPDLDEWSAAFDVAAKETGNFVLSITRSKNGKNARSYREIMKEYWDDPDENLPDLSELITAALAHKKMIDDNYKAVVKIITKLGRVSISAIQRELGVGYNDALEIINEMEMNGLVGPMNESGIRPILESEL